MSPARGSRVFPASRAILTGVLVLLFAGVGTVHVVSPDRLMPIMPAWVPYPRFVVVATGILELLGCVGLICPGLRSWAAGSFALYAVCVFPANLKHAFDHVPVAGLPDSWWYHGPRLAFQPVLVWAPLFAGGLIDWPFRRREPDHPGITGSRDGPED